MIPAGFFEESPLYKKHPYEGAYHLSVALRVLPAINMECVKCKLVRTFHAADPIFSKYPIEYGDPSNQEEKMPKRLVLIEYVCSACTDLVLSFLIRFSEKADSFMKVGQYPPWSIKPDPALREAVGVHLPTLQKGIVNESQGYGIGAFAYYRRIVEEVVDSLLTDISSLIEGKQEKVEYEQKLANVRESKSGEAKIQVVKDLLPSVLRPKNLNPLAVLYEALSKGLHSKSDEECLDLASMIRESLVFLLGEVDRHKKASQSYAKNLESIMKRLDQHGKTKTNPK